MTSLNPEHHSVNVSANARLHMGFLDLCGDLGRQFGSLGVSLDSISTELSITDSGACAGTAAIQATGNDADRAKRYAETLCTRFSIQRHLKIEIQQAIKPHAGLGSGTQMALAVTAFFSTPFPSSWRIILLFDNNNTGLHGTDERTAFSTLEPMPAATADHLCRLAVMQAIPGLINEDLNAFGAAITQIQASVGDHFAPVQGDRFVSPAVREQLHWYATQQAVGGYGQSSWGPTGFVLCTDADTAGQLVNAAAESMPDNRCEVQITRASNNGATITTSSQ